VGDRELRALQLDGEQARRAADFYEAYAEFVAPGVTTGGSPTTSAKASQLGEDVMADVASALRLAGQWAMLFDPRRARSLLLLSGTLWRTMGHGFGYFLSAGLQPDDRESLRAQLLELLAATGALGGDRAVSARSATPAPMRHPQQQAYLLLAGGAVDALGVRRDSYERSDSEAALRNAFTRVMDESPHRRGVTPVGALGTPLRVYWDMARTLLLDPEPRTGSERIVSHLVGLAGRYSESVELAMGNERLWFNGASPVDVIDLDTLIILRGAIKQFGLNVVQQSVEVRAENLGPIASVSINLAIEMREGPWRIRESE
jgi:hypothetical protein